MRALREMEGVAVPTSTLARTPKVDPNPNPYPRPDPNLNPYQLHPQNLVLALAQLTLTLIR